MDIHNRGERPHPLYAPHPAARWIDDGRQAILDGLLERLGVGSPLRRMHASTGQSVFGDQPAICHLRRGEPASLDHVAHLPLGDLHKKPRASRE